MREGAELILRPRLANDLVGRRRATVHVLVRVGRVDERFVYAPILIKNNEIHEMATTRRILEGSLANLKPSDATYTDGVGPRSTLTVTRNGIILAHATRVLGALGHDDPSARAAMIDQNRRVWWFDLASTNYSRFNLATYEQHYGQRLAVVKTHDEWMRTKDDFPTCRTGTANVRNVPIHCIARPNSKRPTTSHWPDSPGWTSRSCCMGRALILAPSWPDLIHFAPAKPVIKSPTPGWATNAKISSDEPLKSWTT
jgi:hypothetical protein